MYNGDWPFIYLLNYPRYNLEDIFFFLSLVRQTWFIFVRGIEFSRWWGGGGNDARLKPEGS